MSDSVPMHMPHVGNGVESAIIQSWLVSVGDLVNEADVVVEVETDKASMELEAPVTGRVVAIHAVEGSEVNVGAIMAEFEESKADE